MGYWHYFIGWNFTFIGTTHLLLFSYRPQEQGKAQGANEFLVFSAAAVGSLFAGQGVVLLGWAWLNLLSIPLLIVVALLIWRLNEQQALAASEAS